MRSEGWRGGGWEWEGVCERKEKDQSQDAERAEAQGGHIPSPRQQCWTEALTAPYDGTSVASSLQKECDQQIFSLAVTPIISLFPWQIHRERRSIPKSTPPELKSSLVNVWASSGSPWVLLRLRGSKWSCIHSPIGG